MDYFGNNTNTVLSQQFYFGISTRADGDMRSEENLIRFCTKKKISYKTLVLMRQVHGNDSRFITDKDILSSDKLLRIDNTDALISDSNSCTLGIFTADCLPIFIIDSKTKMFSAIHAGREGIHKKIHERILNTFLLHNSQPNDITILIGPSVGPCCYSIDLWEQVESFFRENKIANIYTSHICTSCSAKTFYSYSKERENAGRMISYISLKK